MSLLSKILYLYLALLLLSCTSKKAFTTAIKERSGLNEEQLQQVQFYTSNEIILYKTTEQSNAQVKSGKLIVSNKKDDETIVIPKNTPCILVKELGKTFLLSFEYGEGKLLAFGSLTGGQYSLLAEQWKDGLGVLDYAGKKYQTRNGDVFLNFKMKELKRVKRKHRVVNGRKI